MVRGCRLKNPKSQAVADARLLKYDSCVMLTGTPVQNHVGEVCTLLSFVDPVKFGDIGASIARFGGADPSSTMSAAGVRSLREVLKTCMLRRTKVRVSSRPPTLSCGVVPVGWAAPFPFPSA